MPSKPSPIKSKTPSHLQRWWPPLLAVLLYACGDAPLLTTPLPNGYTFHSNGGSYGHVKKPDGWILVDDFGLQHNGLETWCTDFAWQEDTVICKWAVSTPQDPDTEQIAYWVLNTSTHKVTIYPDLAQAQDFWSHRFASALPPLKRQFASTRKR